MRILVAVDGSKDSTRAVKSVGQLLRSTPDVTVTLFHVLTPLPPMLREHGGSEDPIREEELGRQLRKDQKIWYRKEQKLESIILAKARQTLEKTGFSPSRIRLKFGYEEDVARAILEEARKGGYQAIVVGRHGASGLKRLFFGGITVRYCDRQLRAWYGWLCDENGTCKSRRISSHQRRQLTPGPSPMRVGQKEVMKMMTPLERQRAASRRSKERNNKLERYQFEECEYSTRVCRSNDIREIRGNNAGPIVRLRSTSRNSVRDTLCTMHPVANRPCVRGNTVARTTSLVSEVRNG